MTKFAPRLLAWFDRHGRKDLPWQRPRTPYRVWLSEIMLQQTQVVTAIPYFTCFIKTLPNLPALAAAPLDHVLALWSGLGYYSRARNLHRAAELCVERHGGELPKDFTELSALPGIGRSTAGAILAQAWGLRCAILDGNVKRVLARYHGVRGWPGAPAVAAQLWKHSELHTPARRVADYTQAIMDLGATVCTRARPQCTACPLAKNCVALREGQTAALPERKPTRKIPSRSTIMLLLRDRAGRVLLERRPPTGVWAGLWSLPEAADEAAAANALATRYRANGRGQSSAHVLPGIRHQFSHFTLDITPWSLAIAKPDARIADNPQLRWCGAKDAADLGLPAPVRKLLDSTWEKD